MSGESPDSGGESPTSYSTGAKDKYNDPYYDNLQKIKKQAADEHDKQQAMQNALKALIDAQTKQSTKTSTTPTPSSPSEVVLPKIIDQKKRKLD